MEEDYLDTFSESNYKEMEQGKNAVVFGLLNSFDTRN